jgi:DNA topoisomerase-1
MRAAQRLYENGLITYMRTDSTTLSEQAIRKSRSVIAEMYGEPFLSPEPRQYQTKVKNAQEAHEAIRPSGDFRCPTMSLRVSDVGSSPTTHLEENHGVPDGRVARAQHHGQVSDGDAVFRPTGRRSIPGFLRAYVEGADDPDEELADQGAILPDVSVDDPLRCESSTRRVTRRSRRIVTRRHRSSRSSRRTGGSAEHLRELSSTRSSAASTSRSKARPDVRGLRGRAVPQENFRI